MKNELDSLRYVQDHVLFGTKVIETTTTLTEHRFDFFDAAIGAASPVIGSTGGVTTNIKNYHTNLKSANLFPQKENTFIGKELGFNIFNLGVGSGNGAIPSSFTPAVLQKESDALAIFLHNLMLGSMFEFRIDNTVVFERSMADFINPIYFNGQGNDGGASPVVIGSQISPFKKIDLNYQIEINPQVNFYARAEPFSIKGAANTFFAIRFWIRGIYSRAIRG